MRGENCVDASVSVISRIANTIDTTVMIEVAMLLRMTCATPGSWCEGNRVLGIQALIPGIASSSDDSTAPAAPRTMAMANGRMRKPPRSAYIAERNRTGRRSNIRMPNVGLEDIEGLTRLGRIQPIPVDYAYNRCHATNRLLLDGYNRQVQFVWIALDLVKYSVRPK